MTAFSPNDSVVEAVELDSPDHFVVGVQWHPERTCAQSEFSRAIFSAFIGAAEEWQNNEKPAFVQAPGEWSGQVEAGRKR